MAGRARARNAVRIDGKFVTRDFEQIVRQEAEQAGVKNALRYFQQNENYFRSKYEIAELKTSRNAEQLAKDFREHTGIIKINGKRVKKEQAIKQLTEFNQFLKAETDVVAFWMQPTERVFKNEISIDIPDIEDIVAELEEGEEIEDIAERLGISVIRSNRKAVKVGEKIKVTKYDATRGTSETYEKIKVDRRKVKKSTRKKGK